MTKSFVYERNMAGPEDRTSHLLNTSHTVHLTDLASPTKVPNYVSCFTIVT